MAPRLRPDLAELHGYHSPQVDVDVRLNTNESPYPAPDVFVDELRAAIDGIEFNRYPDRAAAGLRAAIAGAVGVEAGAVYPANGSNEVLQTLLLAYGGPSRRALLWGPTYAMHRHIAEITGTPLVALARRDDFSVTPADVDAAFAAHDPDVVFFCNPNNPSGTLEDPEAVAAALAHRDTLVVVDEAYGEFASWSAVPMVADHPNLVVCRTFSKAWSFAAMRLGYALADPALVASLTCAELPYHLDVVTQIAGTLALGHPAEMQDRVARIVSERERVLAALATMDAVTTWKSDANFFLIRPDIDADTVWDGLVRRSVLVRNVASWSGTEGCLRVTVGTPDENDRFLAAIADTLAELEN